ncbi:glutathione S-transferase family protein [Pelagibacteraceae bacterium]|nr:glutathione S-transferase family protein [Pelagibacteraceae bacterium]
MKQTQDKNSKNLTGKQSYRVFETAEPWILYHNDFSLCSRKVRICLAELKVNYKPIHINIIETGSAENLTKEFKFINPNVTVPVLLHNGYPIYESHEQIKYLQEFMKNESNLNDEISYWVKRGSLIGEPINDLEKYAGNCVSLLTPPLFISMLKDISIFKFFSYYIRHPVKFRAFNFIIFKIFGFNAYKDKTPLHKITQKVISHLNNHMREFNSQILNKEWISNNQFSVADITWAVLFHRLEELQILEKFTKSYPAIEQYYIRVKKRYSFKEGVLAFKNTSVDNGVKNLQKSISAVSYLRKHYIDIEDSIKN